MLRPEFGAAHAAFPEFDRIAPAAGRPAAAGGFPALLREVRGEVEDFIAHGSSASGLSAAGAALRLRARMAAEAEPTAAVPSVPDATASLARIAAAKSRAAAAATPVPVAAESAAAVRVPGRQAFIDDIAPWIDEAAERLGVAPHVLIAQAALESGWGQRPLRERDGADTHNLFGLKAGASWRGAVAEVQTSEYEDGAAVQRTERFRSYPDPASAFRDFTRLLLDNPRYRDALNAGTDAVAYAQGLQRGGYATDPAYADKLVRLAAQLQRGG